MLQIALKATTTATDAGVFSAVISAVSVDREGDRVDPDGMVTALKAWESQGKQIPLAWNHSTAPEDIIGSVDPSTAKAVAGEVHIDGWIDQTTPRGQEAWRLVKTGVLGFSFGYMVPEGGATKNAHGGRDIHALDLFEVTACIAPMNNDTRVTGWKSEGAVEAIRAALAPELQQLRDRIAQLEEKAVDVTDKEPPARSVDPLREQARSIALDVMKGGVTETKSPQREPEPREAPDAKALREEARQLVVNALTSGVHSE